jgi:signal transduction histidine kinase
MAFIEDHLSARDAVAGGYVFDGGRSTLIRDSMSPVLDETRALLHADVALALLQGRTGEVCLLAGASDERVELPLTNEPLVWRSTSGRPAQPFAPASLADVVLRSTARSYRLEFATAISVPWRSADGRGWLVVGNLPASWNHGRLDAKAAAAYGRELRRIHHEAASRGTIATSQDLSAALKAVSHAGMEAGDAGELLEAIVVAAKELFGTSVAYIALPERDNEHFAFTSLIGIRTSEFRRLRMRLDQGLGGLARTERRSVRTVDYGEDRRLRGAPVEATRGEGIVSAMSAPLLIDGAIAGTLYVGNRHQTAFSETDADLLEEFAGTATVGLSRQQAEEHRLAVMRQREQERLAFAVHDTVVRSLMQIGFHAEEGLLKTEDVSVKQRLAQIGQAAEYCLENLRENLALLAGDRVRNQDTSVGEIFETLRVVHRRSDVTRTFEARNADRSTELPADVAKTITRIAQEALMNAELHSGCTAEHVLVEVLEDTIEVTIVDDGQGADPAALALMRNDDSPHFGVRGMRTAAGDLGGHVTLEPGPEGGLAVRATIPIKRHWR